MWVRVPFDVRDLIIGEAKPVVNFSDDPVTFHFRVGVFQPELYRKYFFFG